MTRIGPGTEPTVALRDAAVAEAAAEERLRQRRLTRVAAETATLVGTLRDLAEHGAGVVLHVAGDRRLQGRLVAVADDHVVVRTPGDREVHVRTDRVGSLRVDAEVAVGIPQGDRPAAQDLRLLERLAGWVDTTDVALLVDGRADPLRGRLVAVGEDLVTLVDDGHRPVHVAACAIAVVLSER